MLEGIKFITLNEFLRREVNCCFVCGGDRYLEFEVCSVFYRICLSCLGKAEVKRFFRQKFNVDVVDLVMKKYGSGIYDG